MLERMLTTPECSKEAFDLHSRRYFASGLDWIEVDNITDVLKVCWIPKVGVRVKLDRSGANRRHYHHIDEDTAKKLDLKTVNVPLKNYGGDDAVTTIDQVVAPRSKVCRWQMRLCVGAGARFRYSPIHGI